MARVYLDYNASTPIDPRVAAVMRPLLEGPFANPSSSHPGGLKARAVIERGRSQVAWLLGAASELFGSGAHSSRHGSRSRSWPSCRRDA